MMFHRRATGLAAGLWIAASAASMAEDEPPRPVTVVTAERSPLVSSVELTGSVTARRHAQLSARIGGLVERLSVDAGHVVEAGDILMELDDELARLALERVQAERQQAELELAEARRRAEEVRQLASDGAFSRSEAETRETALKVRGAALQLSEVQEREQDALVERHRLLAPFDGVIARKLAEEGEWVETGTPVVELVEMEGLRMDVQAPQELLGRLDAAAEVSVRLDAYPDQTLPGKVTMKVPVKDPVARTFLVRIAIEGAAGMAAPGMSGRAVFRFRSGEDALQVPRDAVVRFPDGSAKVWVVEGEGVAPVARSREVTLGGGLEEKIEIVDGIDVGERVVLRGNEGLREGQAVKILDNEAGRNS